MVAATRTVRVKVSRWHAVFLQVLSCGAVGLDGACGRNVVSGHAVAQLRQYTRTFDFFYWSRTRRHIVKIRSAFDVSGIIVPDIGFTFGDSQPFPFLVAIKNRLIIGGEHARVDGLANRVLHFFLRGPDVAQIKRVALFAYADGVAGEIKVDPPGQRVSHYQRRRHQIVCADFRIDAAFKVAIAGKHRDGDQLFFGDGVGNVLRQRAGVS